MYVCIFKYGLYIIYSFSSLLQCNSCIIYELTYAETLPSDQTEVCDPPCKLGECCKDGKCMCLDTDTLTVEECKGL